MSELEPNQRRRRAIELGTRGMATAFLSDRAPDEADFGLLCAGVTDAALSGDRRLLSGIPRLVQRLEGYLPEEGELRAEWAGRLWAVETMMITAHVLLEIELADARAG